MNKILVAGSSNIDFVLNVRDMPKKGETIVSNNFDKIPGGKGANQACACGKLGGQCSFLSLVGDDGLGNIVLNSLRQAKVDISRVEEMSSTPTGMAVITVDSNGENSIVIVPGANKLCNSRYFQKNLSAIEDSDIVLVQLETPAEDIYKLISDSKNKGKLTILNPAPAPEHIDDGILEKLDFITPNETELQKITGMNTDTIPNIVKAAKVLLNKGVKNVLVTIGSRGSLLCNCDGVKHYSPYKVSPIDTTAAGDTFNAALAVGLAEGKSLDGAITLANAAAALSITKKGAQTSIPTREETENFISDNSSSIETIK